MSNLLQIQSSKIIKLDLNGHTITVTQKKWIVQGTLHVTDSSDARSGKIHGTTSSNSLLIEVQGTFILSAGTVTTEKTYALQSSNIKSTIEMLGGHVKSAKPIKIQSGSTVKVLGGTVESTGNDGWAFDIPTAASPNLVIGSASDDSSPVIQGLISIPGGKGNIQLIGGTIKGVSGKLPAGGTYTSRFESNISGSLPVGSFCVQKNGHWVVTDQPPAGAVAAIGGDTYGTLQGAIDAAADNSEVTLLTNVRENIVIQGDDNVVLNLNGCKISSAADLNSGSGTITVNKGGTLTINDSAGGSVDTTVNGTGALVNHGTVAINGGSFTRSGEGDGNTWYTLDNQGTMTFTGGSVTNDSQTSSLVRNLNGTLTITDGTFENERFTALKNDSGGTLEISGGTVRSTFGQCVQNWNVANISGGEFYGGAVATWSQPAGEQGDAARGTTTISDGAVIYGDVEAYDYLGATKPAVVSITGGTVKGEIKKFKGNADKAEVVEIESDTSTITVSGGVFTKKVDKALLASGTKLVQTDDGYVPVDDSTVALVGTESYASLTSAINKAPEGSTVTLCMEVVESVTIPEGKFITLDLAGFKLSNSEGKHTITNRGALTLIDTSEGKTGTVDNTSHQKAALFNDVSGTAVLNGGTFNRSEENGISSTQSGGNSFYTIQNYGSMTFNEGAVVRQGANEEVGKFSSLIENGWYNGNNNTSGKNATMVINGGSFIGGLNTIKNDDWGELTINDGEFTNTAQAAVLNWNVTTVKGGTFTSDKYAVLNGYLNDHMDRGTLTISGGSFKGGDGYAPVAEMGGATSIGSVSISGGSFWVAPDKAYLADGFEVVKNPNGTFGVKEQPSTPGGSTGGGSVSKPDYAITVPEAEHGKVTVDPERAKAGEEVTVSAEPDEGFEIASVTVTGKDGKAVEVTANADGTWTFEMPKGGATVEVAFACDGGELCPTAGLADVDQSQWYHLAVDWAVETGLMEGYEGTGLFGTGDPLTRAQLAQVLYNRAGAPETEAEEAFADVDSDDWFAPAVAWASSEGLLTGYGDDVFGPDDPLTREQLAVVFWRMAGEPAAEADLSQFPDGADTSAWAVGAMRWAVSTGLLEGYTDTGRLDPAGDLTRAQAATVFFRQAEAATE